MRACRLAYAAYSNLPTFDWRKNAGKLASVLSSTDLKATGTGVVLADRWLSEERERLEDDTIGCAVDRVTIFENLQGIGGIGSQLRIAR